MMTSVSLKQKSVSGLKNTYWAHDQVYTFINCHYFSRDICASLNFIPCEDSEIWSTASVNERVSTIPTHERGSTTHAQAAPGMVRGKSCVVVNVNYRQFHKESSSPEL